MSKRRLLKGMMCMALSSLTFAGSNSVRCFNHPWLSKFTDIVKGNGGDIK